MRKSGSCLGGFVRIVAVLAVLGVAYYKSGFYNHGKSVHRVTPRNIAQDIALPAGTTLKDGIAIAVMVDTSGSMKNDVAAKDGSKQPKIEIAKSVAQKTFDGLRDFQQKNPDKVFQAGLWHFDTRLNDVVPMGSVDPAVYGPAINGLRAEGGTAIGEAMIYGKTQLNISSLKKQFMIIITDGLNESGADPEEVMTAINGLPEEQRTVVYLVAFDIDSGKFAGLQKDGVSVMEAGNAVSLQSALDYILYQKILVEQP